MTRLAGAALAFNLLAASAALAQAPAAGAPQPGGFLQGVLGPAAPLPPGAPAQRGNPMVVARGPSMDLAYEAAKAAIAACAGKHIGVAVLDQIGQPKLYYIPDGSSGAHAFMAFRKANTALLIKAPSEQIVARAAADKDLAAKVNGNPDYIRFDGGLPMIVNGEVIGAIGISGGGPEGIDGGCAAAGLKAVQDRLK